MTDPLTLAPWALLADLLLAGCLSVAWLRAWGGCGWWLRSFWRTLTW